MKTLSLLAMILLTLTACGSDESESTSSNKAALDSEYIVKVESIEALPACNEDNASAMIYVKAEEATHVCNNSNWELLGSNVEVRMDNVDNGITGQM